MPTDPTDIPQLLLVVCFLFFGSVVCRAQKPELVVQTGHSGHIIRIALATDGRALMSAGSDGRIAFWDVTNGQELQSVKLALKNDVSNVAISNDWRILAAAENTSPGKPGNVVLLDPMSGKERRRLTGHVGAVICLSFDPDGKILATGGFDGTIKLWDIESGNLNRSLVGHSNGPEFTYITDLSFSPDGKKLASGSRDGTLRVWDAQGNNELGQFMLEGGVHVLAFSVDSGLLAASGPYGPTKIWDVRNRHELHTLRTSGNVRSISFSPDSRMLVCAGDRITLWDVTTGQELRTLHDYRYDDRLRVSSVAFTPAGLAGAIGSTIRLWDRTTGQPVRTLAGFADPIDSVHLAADGKSLLLAAASGVTSWDIGIGRPIRVLKTLDGLIRQKVLSDTRKLLATVIDTGYPENTVEVQDVETGNTVGVWKHVSVDRLTFHPDNNTLVTYKYRQGFSLWDLRTGQQQPFPENIAANYFSDTRSFSVSPDGRLLAWGRSDDVQLLDMTTRKILHELKAVTPYAIAFSPDSKLVATGGYQSTYVWNSETGNKLFTLTSHSSGIEACAFSPDGKLLATGSLDRQIKLWDMTTGKELHQLTGHSHYVWSVDFSSDSKILMSGSLDGTVKLWDVATGQELANFILLANSEWLAMTPDGLFDGSTSAWTKANWRFSQAVYDIAPVEAFFNEFYYPGLLVDIFAGKRPKAVADIAQKDRRQPQLKLTVPDSSEAKLNPRNKLVCIEVIDAPAGAQDVRLFRNGSLVRVWGGDVLKGQKNVTLEATIPIVAGENKLSAYAFNHDNIKSSDVSLTVTGAESLTRKGTLHILAVGVGEYANPQYNLDYTTDDATAFAAQLKLQQEKLGKYQSVKITTLLNQAAKKENILGEMKKFSGLVQPEDAVVVYFSGHGKADGDHFYLVPHDLGYSGRRDQLSAAGLKQILIHSISDVELEEAFRGIDAGKLFMIIDACNSGQALENKDEPRRGPMNTRGLAQLAYEKGIYILTASQSVEEAFVSGRLKHSYLTYALVEEGLKTKVADKDVNGEVSLREWFDYAIERVPKLREETLQSKSLVEENAATVKAARSQKSQTPRVFYRREPESQPLVVARP